MRDARACNPLWESTPRNGTGAPGTAAQAQRVPGCLTGGGQRGRQRQVAIGHRPGSCSENLRTWPARFGQDRGNRHVNFYLGV